MGDFGGDMARYRARGARGRQLWLNPAIWAIAWYRLGNWLYTSPPNIVVRVPLKLISYIGNKACEVLMEMCIDPQAMIGPGLYIGHIGGVHINPGAVLGKNCDVAHRVTIGTSAMGRAGAPTIGDDVYIGTGATLIGKIRVGNGAKIAANTLVISNVPEGATVMGVPGRIIMRPHVAVNSSPSASVETETLHAK
jgi:serine O-acetyltransferase